MNSYGLYLSAAGVATASHRQDVIANNLANLETDGFKRAMSSIRERPVEQDLGDVRSQNRLLDRLSGGQFLQPSRLDLTQGTLEPTGNPLDIAIEGRGYFAVQRPDGQTRLTRDGRTMLDREGYLITADDSNARVLGPDRAPIQLTGFSASDLSVDEQGNITLAGSGARLATVGTFDTDAVVMPDGNSQFRIANDADLLDYQARVRGGFVERSNVDPASEMVRMMDAQRQLEANANMIRFQDQATGKLVNEVGKIA